MLGSQCWESSNICSGCTNQEQRCGRKVALFQALKTHGEVPNISPWKKLCLQHKQSWSTSSQQTHKSNSPTIPRPNNLPSQNRKGQEQVDHILSVTLTHVSLAYSTVVSQSRLLAAPLETRLGGRVKGRDQDSGPGQARALRQLGLPVI